MISSEPAAFLLQSITTLFGVAVMLVMHYSAHQNALVALAAKIDALEKQLKGEQ